MRKEESNGMWYEVGDEKAVSKCGQALREGTTNTIRQAVTGNDEVPKVTLRYPLGVSHHATMHQAQGDEADHGGMDGETK